MAELNLKQMIDRLNAEFNGDSRKLVFWYDDKAEFAEDMELVYRWIFGSGGKIKSEGSEEVRDEYREMLKQALESELGLPIERYKKIVRKI